MSHTRFHLITRSWGSRPRSPRSGRMASVTPGASRLTARQATWQSETSGRTPGRRSTSAHAARAMGAEQTMAGVVARGGTPTTQHNHCVSVRRHPSLQSRFTSTRIQEAYTRAAQSQAVTSFVIRISRPSLGATCTATTAPHLSGASHSKCQTRRATLIRAKTSRRSTRSERTHAHAFMPPREAGRSTASFRWTRRRQSAALAVGHSLAPSQTKQVAKSLSATQRGTI